ncbi:unnamed protein product [Soboliphyme baturini]|uniref:Uncharacterized protein n=1 Tax=Soboliphyme baturini TaxID=241478 RepID=A0A183IV50_9BILA|nr:unnamed protein product [Soboliphyme baturini]
MESTKILPPLLFNIMMDCVTLKFIIPSNNKEQTIRERRSSKYFATNSSYAYDTVLLCDSLSGLQTFTERMCNAAVGKERAISQRQREDYENESHKVLTKAAMAWYCDGTMEKIDHSE